MKRKLVILAVIVIAIPIMLMGWDRYQDRQVVVKVTEVTSLFASEAEAAYGSHAPVKSMTPETSLRVKRTTYGKDYWALLVETADGTVGWIVADQKGIVIIKHRNRN